MLESDRRHAVKVKVLVGFFVKKIEKYLTRVVVLSLVLIFCAGPEQRGGRSSLIAWLVPAAAIAGPEESRPPGVAPGLMWNRSGLPAIFPLQVKTHPGKDYFLTLIDAETGKDTLAAFVYGGAFFKVLVPPGTFVVRFAVGDIWQGETNLFGPGAMTTVVELEKPLTFKVVGYGRKAGHLVDLTGNAPGQHVMAKIGRAHV